MIIKADKDQNKVLTIDEFGNMVHSINYVISKDLIRDMFAILDQNNSSTIDISEVRRFLS